MLQVFDQILTLALNGSSCLYMDGLAWTITKTTTWIPVAVILFYVIIRNNEASGVFVTLLGLVFCIFVADQVSSSVFKPWIARFRPTNDPFLMYSVDVVNGYRGGKYGFFSSHAANTMAVATFISLVVRYRVFSFWIYSWALLNCWSRVYLGVHYLGDLFFGTLWGIIVGWGIWHFWQHCMNRYTTRNKFLSFREGFTTNGYSISSVRLLMASIAFTYLLIAFYALFFFI